jgi:hypothetical protein
MKSCSLVVGVTLPALEGQINRILADDESAQLIGLLFAQGTGFVSAIVQEARKVPSSGTAKRPDEPKRDVKSKVRT